MFVFICTSFILGVPLFVSAIIDPSAVSSTITIGRVFMRVTEVLNLIIPFLVLLATVIFLWGVVKYITAGGDEQRLKEGRMLVMGGIIALAAMIAVWGFVKILLSAFFGETVLPPIPGPSLDPFL